MDKPWLEKYDAGVPHTMAYPHRPLYHFLEQSAQMYPDKPCTVFQGAVITFKEMDQITDYLSLCAEFDMEALVEVHHEADFEKVQPTKACLIGINNRDLTTFETDIQRAVNLVRRLAPDQIPVAASGIAGPDDQAQAALKCELAIHRRNLYHLREQAAQYGTLNVPLFILNQIDGEEKAIQEIEQELVSPASDPANHSSRG